LFSVVVVQFSV